VKSHASLTQAAGSRLGETVNRGPMRLTSSRLSEPLLAWAKHSSPKGEVPRLCYTCSNVP